MRKYEKSGERRRSDEPRTVMNKASRGCNYLIIRTTARLGFEPRMETPKT
jgi:hypothetical protein